MKNHKIILIFFMAIIEGILFVIPHVNMGDEFKLAEIIRWLAFGNVSIGVGSLPNFIYSLFLYIAFQVICGTNIYEHFCSASIYFFCRCTKKKRWFLREVSHLGLWCFFYMCVLVISSVIFCQINGRLLVQTGDVILFAYYIAMNTLWLFITTLLINVIGIIWDSVAGFCIVCGIQILCVGLYGILEQWMDFSKYVGKGMEAQILVLKLIPLSNVVLKWHSSTIAEVDKYLGELKIVYDLNESMIILLAASVLCVFFGMIVVCKVEIITEKE